MTYIFSFVIGTVTASFLGLVIDRLPIGKSIITPRSHCSNCGTYLKYFELIPIFSQLYLRFRCRYCGSKIPFYYALLELYTGLIFLGISLHVIDSKQVLFLMMCALLAILDLKFHEFPFMVWLVFSLPIFCLSPFQPSHLLFLLLALLADKIDLKIGSGDLLWIYTASLILSYSSLFLLLFVASLSGIISIFIFHKKGEIAFIPHLSLAYLVLLVVQKIL